MKRPFLNKIRVITRRQIINTPCPMMALTTEIVSGRVEMKSRLTSVARDVIPRTKAVRSCRTATNLLIIRLNLAIDGRT